MLDLNAPVRTVAGVDLAAHTEDPLRFYVLPPPPRVAMAQGGPELELLRFVRDGELTGGHLRLAVELAHPPARLEAARAQLADELRDDTVALGPLPVVEATAELLFLGRETDAEGGLGPLVRRGYGRAVAGFVAPHRAAFSITPTPDGVRLIAAALASGGAPVGVVYRLKVEGLWPAQRVLARVDWGQVYDHFSLHRREGELLFVEDVRRLRETLVQQRAISIEAVAGLVPEEGGEANDLAPALALLDRELVERFCEPVLPLSREPAHASLGTMGEMFGVGSAFAVKKITQIERAVAEIDLSRGAVLSRTLTVQAHLADLLGGADPAAHIADAGLDHPFFARFGLHVAAARPLADLHLDEVLLRFAYGTSSAVIRLTPQQADGAVETWADAAPDRTWSLLPEVAFAADAPLDAGRRVQLAALGGQGRELTLDLERLLGMARLDVRGTADPRVLLSRLALRQRRGADTLAEREVALSPATPRGELWLRDLAAGDRLEARAEHLLDDGRLVAAAPFVVDTRIVLLPPPFPGAMTVQLIADDDWSELERVVVALQKTADQPAGSFVLDAPGKLVAVSLDMPDPTDRGFRYRVSRTLAGGGVEEDDWVTTDQAVVVVGRVASNRLVVDVTPVGPELPDAGITLVEVELSYLDPENQVRDETTCVIHARADRCRWVVAIADPHHRAYRYRVSVHRTSGALQVGAWTTSTERLLVVPITRAAEG